VRYGCKLEDLLAVLHDSAPEEAEAVVLRRRRVDHGLLSIGLKIHCLGEGRQFLALVERLGGASKVLDMNMYRHAQASLCLVLPPVSNARAAILLLECIERFTGSALIGDRKVQIQVCSPGSLNTRRSALLGIGFYLGLDTLRRYACGDLETTVSYGRRFQRGRRLIIYDGGGEFDRNFEWWERFGNGKDRLIRLQLPFKNGRSDLLAGSGSKLHQGYWSKLGERFEEDMQSLFDRHLLAGLVTAPWVRADEAETADDKEFLSALQELVAYAFEESVRVKKQSGILIPRLQKKSTRSSQGILHEMQSLLKTYRAEIVRQSRLADEEGRT
jgi:hypothetical protein